MKIHIITMEDPLYTLDFIKAIIRVRHKDIVGVTLARGGRLKIGSKHSKLKYLLSLSLIMGIPSFSRYVAQTIQFRLIKKIPFLTSPGLDAFARKYNIPVDYTADPNNQEYLQKLRCKPPDVIINQGQFIIKKELLSIAPMGMLNRHNALLPKNRGRLTPFWVLYHQEAETAVSIHFVDEGIDSGPIIVQKRFAVDTNESFRTLVNKNYYWAPLAMLEALEKLERGDTGYMPNPDSQATYNTVPNMRQAWDYRRRKFWKLFVD